MLVVGGATFYFDGWEEPAPSVRAAYAQAASYAMGSGASVSLPMGQERRPLVSFAAEVPTQRVTLPVDAVALIAEQATLQQLAAGLDLSLSPAQWKDLAEVTLHFQAVRHAYEATIAQAARTETGAYRMAIPSYSGAGDTLRAQFHAALQEKLGPAISDQVIRRMGGGLEGHFAGFGVGVQTLEFLADKSGADSDYRVTRTIQFWNSIQGGEELTTRRETHFPGLEDPAGHTWGPFLAVLAAGSPAKS